METNEQIRLRADAERLADIFTALQRNFVLNLSDALIRGHVSFPQYLLLSYLSQREEAPTMTEVATQMRHTTAAATGLVDRLEKLGYARRQTFARDRRKVFVYVTTKGSELVARVREDMVKNLMLLLTHLEPSEQAAWVRIYEKIFPLCPQ